MQLCSFELDNQSKDLCVIVAPFGQFKHNGLPAGIKQPPDFAQEILEDTLRDIQEREVRIDEMFEPSATHGKSALSLSNAQSLACEKVTSPSIHSSASGERKKPIASDGLKRRKKKIEAILSAQPPCSIKEARSFIGQQPRIAMRLRVNRACSHRSLSKQKSQKQNLRGSLRPKNHSVK